MNEGLHDLPMDEQKKTMKSVEVAEIQQEVKPHPLNGLLIKRDKDTIFIPLPSELWRNVGRCDCKHCKGKDGFLDTLAVPVVDRGFAWVVHYPELHKTHF